MGGTFDTTTAPAEVLDVTSVGKGIKLIKQSKVEFTHAKAKWVLDLLEFPGDRTLQKSHVSQLVTAMIRGTFHPEWVTLITCKLGKEVYRMNGQHTAWARRAMPKDFKCKVDVFEYEAKTLDDVRQLYASIDRNRSRSKSHVTNSYLQGHDTFSAMKAGTLKRLPAGFALFKWEKAKERSSNDGDAISFLILTEYSNAAKRVGSFLDQYTQTHQKHIFRAPVIAAMFAIFEKGVKAPQEFWTPVADGTGFETANDPRNRLRTKLMNMSIGSPTNSTKGNQKVSREYMFRMCLMAWNAWREEREIRTFRVVETGDRPTVKK